MTVEVTIFARGESIFSLYLGAPANPFLCRYIALRESLASYKQKEGVKTL